MPGGIITALFPWTSADTWGVGKPCDHRPVSVQFPKPDTHLSGDVSVVSVLATAALTRQMNTAPKRRAGPNRMAFIFCFEVVRKLSCSDYTQSKRRKRGDSFDFEEIAPRTRHYRLHGTISVRPRRICSRPPKGVARPRPRNVGA